MSTISTILSIFNTKMRSRQLTREFRAAYSDVNELTDQTIELVKGESFSASSEKFMFLCCSEELPVTITHYTKSGESWSAGTPQVVLVQGVLSFPGKVSISINNPSDNTSDLPYRFYAMYS